MNEQAGLISVADQTKRLNKLLDEKTAQIARALPPGTMTADRFSRVVLTICSKNLDLISKCNHSSLLRAVMESAQLGLSPDPVLGEAWFVPFKGNVQMIPGYKGLIKLAWQSGMIAKISARIVNDGDNFSYEYGLNEKLVHVPNNKTQDMTHVYSIARIKDGESMFNVLTRNEVNAIKERSPSARSHSSPWITDFNAMALKSSLRRLCKLLPLSTTNMNIAKAIVLDEQAENGLAQTTNDFISDENDGNEILSLDEAKTEQTK